ncbi:MAG: hypothetical protein ACRDA5_00905 [Clostridium sp.]
MGKRKKKRKVKKDKLLGDNKVMITKARGNHKNSHNFDDDAVKEREWGAFFIVLIIIFFIPSIMKVIGKLITTLTNDIYKIFDVYLIQPDPTGQSQGFIGLILLFITIVAFEAKRYPYGTNKFLKKAIKIIKDEGFNKGVPNVVKLLMVITIYVFSFSMLHHYSIQNNKLYRSDLFISREIKSEEIKEIKGRYESVPSRVTSKGTRTKGYSFYYINIELNNGKDIRIYDSRIGKNPFIKNTILDFCDVVKEFRGEEVTIDYVDKVLEK